MLSWLFGKDLRSHLSETRTVRISGVRFKIKKINTINYLEGAKALKQVYDTYKTKGNETDFILSDKKVIEHFSHVIVCGTVSPRFTYNDDGSGIHIEQLFVDWDMTVNLYNAIMEFTYGKKKL